MELGQLIILFTLVPFIELYLLIRVGQIIGAGYTLAIVVFTGVAGAYLAKMQGLATFRGIQQELSRGKMPAEKMFDGLMILVSGILLMTPGFITDILGFMGLVPLTRDRIKKWLMTKVKNMTDNGEIITITSYKTN